MKEETQDLNKNPFLEEKKVDITPQRLTDESYEDYKKRRTEANKHIKQKSKGKLFHISSMYSLNKVVPVQGTYYKNKETSN